MSKLKSSETPRYELLYIVPNKYTEEEVGPIVKKVNELVKKHDGQITHNEEWGKKKLAYAIDKNVHGYYNLVEFEIDGENVNKIDNELRLSNEILRHQIVVKKIKTAQAIEKEKEIAEKIAAKVKEEEKAEEEAKKEPAKKVDLKELDEKLDKILESDDLL